MEKLPYESIEPKIYSIRNYRVMLDRDLAALYGLRAKALRQQIFRNKNRFPEDFMFQIKPEEANLLISQNAIPSRRHLGGHLPLVFTQEGAAMLSGVLRTERAVQANIVIMRAFVRMRELFALRKDLATRLSDILRVKY